MSYFFNLRVRQEPPGIEAGGAVARLVAAGGHVLRRLHRFIPSYEIDLTYIFYNHMIFSRFLAADGQIVGSEGRTYVSTVRVSSSGSFDRSCAPHSRSRMRSIESAHFRGHALLASTRFQACT